MEELDGIILLLANVKFKGKDIGLISEQGMTRGGTDAEYIEVTAAQRRAVVKRALKKMGTIEWSFRMIEMKAQNMVDIMGGSVDQERPGKWNAPAVESTLEGEFEIEAVTGQVIHAAKVELTARPAGTIGGDDPYGADVTVRVAYDGVNSPYSIDNTALEEG